MLLDSNIIIYAVEPDYDSVRRFISEQEAVVSAISRVEVLGYHKLIPHDRQRLEPKSCNQMKQ